MYGHRASSFTKEVKYFYGPDAYGSPTGIIRADNVSHGRQRKLVSHAFSDKALRDQEQLLKGYVGILIGQLKGTASGSKETDMVKWYNFTTFDIMVRAPKSAMVANANILMTAGGLDLRGKPISIIFIHV